MFGVDGEGIIRTGKGHTGGQQLRAGAYLRVSSEKQLEGHSLDAQRRAIEAA